MTIIVDSKRDFVDVIKLGILRWEDGPGLSKWAQGNDQDSSKRESNEKMEVERVRFEHAMLLALKMKERSMEQECKKYSVRS